MISEELHNVFLALDQVKMTDDYERNLIIFSRSKSVPFGPKLHTPSCPADAGTPSVPF